VASVSPSVGVVGATITITGTGFAGGQTVFIGGVAGSPTHVNGTTKTCPIPSGVSLTSTLDVTVAGVTLANAITPLAFASAFTTATGTTQSAVGDGGKWNGTYSNNDAEGEVIASTGLNFPSTNTLRITAIDTVFVRGVKTDLPVPAVGQSQYHRWYFRPAWPDSTTYSDGQNHPIEGTSGTGGSARNWAFRVNLNQNTNWSIELYSIAGGGSFASPQFTKAGTYRIELRISRTGTNTMEFHARIYNSSDTLLYSDADFNNGSTTLDTNPSLTLTFPDDLDAYQMGNNGWGAGGWSVNDLYCYQGCFAVSLADWCGAYQSGEVG